VGSEMCIRDSAFAALEVTNGNPEV
jgi:hypothetical protein